MKIPESWEEINVATFQRLAHLENDYTDTLALLAALMNVSRKELMNSKDNLRAETTAALKLVALQQPTWESQPDPSVPARAGKKLFTFEGKQYKVPKDLSFQRFGQKVLLQNKLLSEEPADCIAYAVALYMQPILDGSFDDEKIEPLEQKILLMPALDIFWIATFFLNKLKLFKRLGSVGFNPFH
ncbi:hypothetical protein IIB97_02200 [Patescibacteria group bacterium]|nr:hypothetical protein [Patescibacteria group bacterium]